MVLLYLGARQAMGLSQKTYLIIMGMEEKRGKMLGCYYFSLLGQAFGWTQLVPGIVGLVLFVVTAATHEMVYVFFGLFLYAPQFMVWIFQWFFQMIRPDPICQLYHTWAFPSMESMYVGAIVGFFITYAICKEIDHSWITWLAIYIFTIFPLVILFYSGYNRWWELLFSLGFGLVSSILFALVYEYFIQPRMAYLRCHFPFSFFEYVDCESQKDYEEILRSLQ